MVEGKVINILQPKMDRMKCELQKRGSLPVSYLCVKYGSDVFVELLSSGEIRMDDSALVSLVDEEDEEPVLRAVR
jgi:hypothetical protein